ncbi:unnamed protein product [Albugo candida]|uniref:Uncharacterized protein n=1 Tax=Albugo candida TaxID=65357 RepID=A0A024G8G7_9STRA|nr:unnamed protein product [Albugo candida]|eukprot:CCI42934.1 unnamed protein product [Albugo candida]
MAKWILCFGILCVENIQFRAFPHFKHSFSEEEIRYVMNWLKRDGHGKGNGVWPVFFYIGGL